MDNYLKDNYFAQRLFDTDEQTGLKRQLRAYKLEANSETKTIRIYWKLVLLSPTGAVMETKSEGFYERYNGTVPKYDNLKQSEIGIGISQMIETLDFANINDDLSNFPECLNQE